jgi:myo-inositol-1(or 4)-monophosphatase
MSSHQTGEFLETAVAAAMHAGEIIVKNIGRISKDDIGLKEASDFVTRVDLESEETIIRMIRAVFPHHHFLSEEGTKESESEYRWIIDPLDGTTNFIHGYPIFSVSIALEHEKETVTGVVFDPIRNEFFTAEKGSGSFLNGLPIRVSGVDTMGRSLITTGFPFRKREVIDTYLRIFKGLFLKVSDLRRTGSAAIDLSYVACGRCEGFFEFGLSPWDMAAGALIIREAGGIVSDFGGGEDYLKTGNIIAGNPSIHRSLLQEIRKVVDGEVSR